MNFIGKSMVMLYSMMALACLIWSAVVFTNRVDWAPPKDAPAQPKAAGASAVPKEGSTASAKEPPAQILGKVNQANAKITLLDAANERAIKRWVANYVSILQAEQDRLNRRSFLAGRLEIARTGKLGEQVVAKPLRELTIDEATGLAKIDLEVNEVTGKYVVGQEFEKQTVIDVRPGKPALSGFVYLRGDGTNKMLGIIKTNEEILKTQDAMIALIKEHALATEIINTKQPTGVPKGLRQLIKDQIAIEKIAVEERESLSDAITNRRADAQLFIKRRDLLQARVQELMRLRPSGSGKME